MKIKNSVRAERVIKPPIILSALRSSKANYAAKPWRRRKQGVSKDEAYELKRGFTLIELKVVIALMAFITTLAFANVSFLNRFLVQAEVNHMYTACRYIQQKACATHQEQTINFNVAQNSYIFAHYKHSLAKPVIFGSLPDVKGPPSSARISIKNPITFKNNTIVCYPTGIISAGTVYLTDNKQSVYALSCPVGSVSYLRKYRYANGWQLII